MSSQQPQKGVLAPIKKKKKANEVQKDFTFTQGHRMTERAGQSVNPGLHASEPATLPRSARAVGTPQTAISWQFCLEEWKISQADNSLLLSTWTTCPFIGKGDDSQLHPVTLAAPCSAHGDGEAQASPAPWLLD